jgi:hypothetical protein
MSQWDEEIARKVEAWDAAGKVLHPSWIAMEICNDHEEDLARGQGADWWKHRGFRAVRQDVGRFIAKNYGQKAEDDAQHVLPGCEYVQRRYIVKRDGDDVAVLVEDMTDEEIEAKAQELEKRGRSCIAHADELRLFGKRRKRAA